MRLLITVGYQKLLLPADCNWSAVVEALSKAMIVEETGPYDHRVLKISESGEAEIKLLLDDDVRIPTNARPEYLDRLLSISRERDEFRNKIAVLEKQLGEARKAVTAT